MSKKMKNFIKNPLLILGMTFLPTLALADTGTNKIVSVLNGLINILTSGVARAIAIIAILSIGYYTLVESKIPLKKAASSAIGIGIIFSAAYIINVLGIGS